ncbi:bifunctional UDP-sugar hydrolase/5'-nucleotidase UshA [Thaumasiovibrio sp. DFM-14]|uniref:bifunctional UDP-sugar hydrolase/5'-nucleotidase UshA n=1 Tax=Thaumasiovibrio sp. DFM-14 TaxID=3384792 RepID=UPI0039A194C0
MTNSRFLRTAISAALLATLMGCSAVSQPSSWEKDTVYKLTILHTNDHHGRFWQNRHGEYGMAARKTLLNQLRADVAAEGGISLLLSGGDINTGVPESDLQNAEPDFKGMNLLGYDAMALGNHEFDNPLDVLMQQQEWANFPMLSANIFYRESGERAFQAYEIFDLQGIKVAVIGLTTEDTAKVVNPDNVKTLEFRDPKVEAQRLIDELKASENPDVIIATTHMGHYAGGNHGVNAPGDVALARYVNAEDLHIVVGGHSQEPVCMEGPNMYNTSFAPGDECKPDNQNDTWIVQAHEWGKYVGKADFEFINGELNMVSYDLIPVNLKKKIKLDDGSSQRVFIQDEIEENEKVLEFLRPYQERGQDLLGEIVAEATGKLEGDRNKVRFEQTSLGRLIAKAHMERANADFGIMNSGGVRDSIGEGEFTYRDVLIVQPFGNMVTYNDFTGSEVLDYLNVVANKPVDSGAYAQFYGIEMIADGQTVQDVRIGGEPIDLEKVYRFTLPEFNAAGGDGYPVIKDHPGHVNTGFVDAEVLKAYLQANSPINPADYDPRGEIVYK